MTTPRPGLRERKKEATRKALRDAALRLALERGPDNVRVDDIADAAGVSPRTYNNYFSSREQAIVAAVTAEREARVAAAVAARPASVRLSGAVVEAIVEQYTNPGSHDPRALLLITNSPALRDAFLGTAAGIEHPLTAVIAERIGDTRQLTAQVLSASVAAAVRIALGQWVRSGTAFPAASGLVVPSGSLPDLLRTALAPLAPALDATGERPQQQEPGLPASRPGDPTCLSSTPTSPQRRPAATGTAPLAPPARKTSKSVPECLRTSRVVPINVGKRSQQPWANPPNPPRRPSPVPAAVVRLIRIAGTGLFRRFQYLTVPLGRARHGLRRVLDIETARTMADYLDDLAERVNHGEGVSGPAAHRIITAARASAARFQGMFLTPKMADAWLDDPRLTVYDNPDAFLTCNHDPAKALCRPGQASRQPPAIERCDPACANIARTDAHVSKLREEITQLKAEITDPLTPAPLRERLKQRITFLHGIAERHHHTRLTRSTQESAGHE